MGMAGAGVLLDEVHRFGRAGDPAIAMVLGSLSANRVRDIALATVALLFTALTTVLLVWDLEHKERFLCVVFTPQSRSWLARGAFILIGYSGLCGVFWLAAVAGFPFVTVCLVVADGFRRILCRCLYRVSLWTMRRSGSMANEALSATSDRASTILRHRRYWRCFRTRLAARHSAVRLRRCAGH